MTLSLEELEKPKPCPRCEVDKPEVYSECEDFDDLVYRVNCGYCGFKSKCADNETQAIIYWNESLAQELRADLNAAKAENEKLRESLEDPLIKITEGLWFTLYWDARNAGDINDMSQTGIFAQHTWDELPERYRKALPDWWEDHGHVSVAPHLDRNILKGGE